MSNSKDSSSLESRLTKGQIQKARDEFKSYDTDNDDVVTVAEFKKVLVDLFTQEELQQLVDEADPNGDGIINWDEFLVDYFKHA